MTYEETDQPFVSVIVPVRNESGHIAACIEGLALQTYPRGRFEVILVDGESTDATLAEAHAAAQERALPLQVVSNPRRTTATGLNLGLEQARGAVIVRVDGHVRVDPSFLAAGVLALQESGADAVGGPIRTRSRGPVGAAIALAMSSPFGVGDAVFRYSQEEQWTDSVPFGAYRRHVFDRIGRFAEDIDRGEDDEFNYRLRQSGGRLLLTPRIGSTYYARESLAALLRQYWGYGIAKANVLLRHPGRLRPRHLVPTTLVLALLLGLLRPLDRRCGRIAALAAFSYGAANLIATGLLARRHGWLQARLVPLAFAAMHLGAGAGMIAGFARWAALRARRSFH